MHKNTRHAFTMRVLYLVFISQVCAHLQCDKTIIHATVGSSLKVVCTYNTRQFRFSKKYWCLGESQNTCEILMDTDGFTKAGLRIRAKITDEVYYGLHISVMKLQLGDTGIYWVGVDKIYADIMFQIRVDVTEEAVSRPTVWPVGSPFLTCRGQPLSLRCRSERGTLVQYSWYRKALPEAVLLHSTSDLPLQCASLLQDGQFFCSAHNTVSRENSEAVFITILQPGPKDCVYSLTSVGFESYDCTTTTIPPTTTTPPWTTTLVEVQSSALVTWSSGCGNQSVHTNQTWVEIFFLRSWSGVPLWYDIARWILFTAMMVSTCLVHMCTRSRAGRHRATHKHRKPI